MPTRDELQPIASAPERAAAESNADPRPSAGGEPCKDERVPIELTATSGVTVRVMIPRQCAEQIAQALQMFQSAQVSYPVPEPPGDVPLSPLSAHG